VAPVLSFGEVEAHPHNKVRATFRRRDGVLQPGPAPRYSRTQCEMGAPGRGRGADSEAVLQDWGYAPAEIAELKKAGVVGAG
jgi:alpha-methylacyl-CoA racemase